MLVQVCIHCRLLYNLGYVAHLTTLSSCLMGTAAALLTIMECAGLAITAAGTAAADSGVRPVATAPSQGKRIVSGRGEFAFPVYKPKRRESFAPPLRCHIRTNALIVPDGEIFAASNRLFTASPCRSKAGSGIRLGDDWSDMKFVIGWTY